GAVVDDVPVLVVDVPAPVPVGAPPVESVPVGVLVAVVDVPPVPVEPVVGSPLLLATAEPSLPVPPPSSLQLASAEAGRASAPSAVRARRGRLLVTVMVSLIPSLGAQRSHIADVCPTLNDNTCAGVSQRRRPP